MNDKKVVLITGVSSGIGKATAIRLARLGYLVYGTVRQTEKIKDLKENGVKILKMDVTKDEQMMETVKTIIKEQEKIDILINNAGYGSFGALEDVSITEGKHQFEVNLFGMARMIQLVLPQMRKQKSGRIINISSVAGKIYEPCGSWYHSTKFAVEGLSDCLRLEVKEFGIKIIMIEPGPTKSKWNEVARENLIKVSGKTDYKNVIEKSFRLLKNMERTASPASSVVSQIEKAINSRNPKARYVSGKGIKMIILLRRILSDKVFDWLTEMAMK